MGDKKGKRGEEEEEGRELPCVFYGGNMGNEMKRNIQSCYRQKVQLQRRQQGAERSRC